MKTIYDPLVADGNPYCSAVVRCIKENGYEVCSLSEWDASKRTRIATVINLNWFDEIVSRRLLGAIRQLVRKSLLLYRIKRSRSQIVVTIHNILPHDGATGRDAYFTKILRKKVLHQAAAIVILCDATVDIMIKEHGEKFANNIKAKIVKIPHENYAYVLNGVGDIDERECSNNNVQLLFYGAIRRYKGIEVLLQAASNLARTYPNLQIKIIGKCSDSDYASELESACALQQNVSFENRFMDDSELVTQIYASTGLVFPYDMKSTLNSSSCIMAFTLGRTVICPQIGTLNEVSRELIYSYTYASEVEHVQQLTHAIERFVNDYADNPAIIANKGKQLQSIVMVDNSHDRVRALYQQLYSDLFEKAQLNG